MNRCQKLINLTKYLSSISVGATDSSGVSKVRTIMRTAQADATSALAHSAGQQIVIARPEMKQSGDEDGFTSIISTAIFVLEKKLGSASTEPLEEGQYARLLELAEAILSQISDDITRGYCGLLSGLSLSEVNVTPEASIFGGWLGWSLELHFE